MMGVRILAGEDERGREIAVLYCSSSSWAFGPLFPSREVAEAFLYWLETDPRRLPDHLLERRYYTFMATTCHCGHDPYSHEEGWCSQCGCGQYRSTTPVPEDEGVKT